MKKSNIPIEGCYCSDCEAARNTKPARASEQGAGRQEFEFWSDGSCVFLRVPQANHESDPKHVSHGLSEGTARRLLSELTEILQNGTRES